MNDFWSKLFGKHDEQDILVARKKKKLLFNFMIFLIILLLVVIAILLETSSNAQKEAVKNLEDAANIGRKQIDLPDEHIDKDQRWRQYMEKSANDALAQMKAELIELIKSNNMLAEKSNAELLDELAETKEKLQIAQQELSSASLDMKRIAAEQQEQAASSNEMPEKAVITMQDMTDGQAYEMDIPKPADSFMPEGTYFNGHLLGGIAVSTAVSAAESPVPVTIRLTGRGNLEPDVKLDVTKCRIIGSAYGDYVAERAIIRLEKLLCTIDGVIHTTDIAGQVFGPDGYNGVQGTLVTRSEKHLRKAMLGSVISGFAGTIKGQDAAVIFGNGTVGTSKKTFQDLAGQGAMQGASNAGEKLADYYLRQAEALSPMLYVPGGVEVSPQIIKGVFFGERGLKKKIQEDQR